MKKYEDMINLPRHISKTRSKMSTEDRAAQFSPFAALTGHDAAVKETARKTSEKIELDPYIKEEINYRIMEINRNIKNKPLVRITYFKEDVVKSGGEYKEIEGKVTKIDEYNKELYLENELIIKLDEIVELTLANKS